MNIKPLADRVVIKALPMEEKQKAGSSCQTRLRKSLKKVKSSQ